MRRVLIVLSLAIFLCRAVCGQAQQAGDAWIWFPLSPETTSKDAQIVRNTQYVSVKLQAAHISYKSGYLENIKKVVISSSVTLNLQDKPVQGTNVNLTWQKSNKAEDSILVDDLLAVLSPTTPSSLSIKVNFNGIGQDKFASIFDALSSGNIKTAIDLSAATLAKADLATSILQKFLASPYTSSNPKDVLSMSQSFVIYPDRNSVRPDSFREGYIVVISASEKKSADLSVVTSLSPDNLRFDSNYHVLQIKGSDGSWRQFTGNSYVVLSVSCTTVRGTDENSTWFKKYAEAKENTEKLLTGGAQETVKKDSETLWIAGTTLLDADPNYLSTERESIRLKAYQDVQDALKKNSGSGRADIALDVPGIPYNYKQIVSNYDQQVKNTDLSATIQVRVHNERGQPIPNTEVRLTNLDKPDSTILAANTNTEGVASFRNLKPGAYAPKLSISALDGANLLVIQVHPTETKNIQLEVPAH